MLEIIIIVIFFNFSRLNDEIFNVIASIDRSPSHLRFNVRREKTHSVNPYFFRVCPRNDQLWDVSLDGNIWSEYEGKRGTHKGNDLCWSVTRKVIAQRELTDYEMRAGLLFFIMPSSPGIDGRHPFNGDFNNEDTVNSRSVKRILAYGTGRNPHRSKTGVFFCTWFIATSYHRFSPRTKRNCT